MTAKSQIDDYIGSLPEWHQVVCNSIRRLIHKAEPEIVEEIKFRNRPYFTLMGNVCALQDTADHINIFLYDPNVADPSGLINQGHGNTTARSIQLYEGDSFDEQAFTQLIANIADRNRRGGWRRLPH